MKKILLFLVVLMLGITPSFAKNKDNYTIKFDGVKYNLLYSTKNKETGGYINEYYKPRETYNIWSEMVALHSFPNAYSPIDQIIDFRKYLNEKKCKNFISFNEDKNIGLIDFVVVRDERAPIVMEYNVFKYTKTEKDGSVAIQYAKRYAARNAFEEEEIKREFEKIRKKTIEHVADMKVPVLVAIEIDKCAVKGKNEGIQEEKTVVDEKNDIVTETKEKEEVVNAEQAEEVSKEHEVSDMVPKNELQKNISEKTSEENELSQNNDSEKAPEKDELTQKNESEKSSAKIKPVIPIDEHKDYHLENTRYQQYAQPKDYKELIEEIKALQKEQKKLKKAAKKRAKKANKNLKGQ